MPAALRDLALLDHQDLVGVEDSGQISHYFLWATVQRRTVVRRERLCGEVGDGKAPANL